MRSNSSTASSSIERTDQKSASVTHTAVKLVCVTKFTHSLVECILPLLVIYGLSFALPLWCILLVMLGFRFKVNTVWPMSLSVPEFMCEFIVLCSTCTCRMQRHQKQTKIGMASLPFPSFLPFLPFPSLLFSPHHSLHPSLPLEVGPLYSS